MSKKELIDVVAMATELSKDKAGLVVDALILHIEKTIKKGEEVRIPGFGTFKVANRKARKGRNPQTGAEMTVKAAFLFSVDGARPHIKRALLFFACWRKTSRYGEERPWFSHQVDEVIARDEEDDHQRADCDTDGPDKGAMQAVTKLGAWVLL